MLYVDDFPDGFREGAVRCKIRRRRRQLLIHSYLYYEKGVSLISDTQWDEWAQQLVKLQNDHPYIGQFLEFHEAFKDFDGSSGYDLPYMDDSIRKVGDHLLNYGTPTSEKRNSNRSSKIRIRRK